MVTMAQMRKQLHKHRKKMNRKTSSVTIATKVTPTTKVTPPQGSESEEVEQAVDDVAALMIAEMRVPGGSFPVTREVLADACSDFDSFKTSVKDIVINPQYLTRTSYPHVIDHIMRRCVANRWDPVSLYDYVEAETHIPQGKNGRIKPINLKTSSELLHAKLIHMMRIANEHKERSMELGRIELISAMCRHFLRGYGRSLDIPGRDMEYEDNCILTAANIPGFRRPNCDNWTPSQDYDSNQRQYVESELLTNDEFDELDEIDDDEFWLCLLKRCNAKKESM